MLKLLIIIVCSWIAFLLLPGVVAFVAGFILVASCLALLVYGIASFVSFISSTTLSVLGGMCTFLLFCVAAVIIAMTFPVLLVVAVAAFATVFICGCIVSAFVSLV